MPHDETQTRGAFAQPGRALFLHLVTEPLDVGSDSANGPAVAAGKNKTNEDNNHR